LNDVLSITEDDFFKSSKFFSYSTIYAFTRYVFSEGFQTLDGSYYGLTSFLDELIDAVFEIIDYL
jgi:hypothetical protein